MADSNTNPKSIDPKDTSDSSSKRYTPGSQKGEDLRSRLESERKTRQRATDSATGIFASFQKNISPEDQEHEDAVDAAIKSEDEGMSFMERLSNRETAQEKRERISSKIKVDTEPEKGSFFDIFSKSEDKKKEVKPDSKSSKDKDSKQKESKSVDTSADKTSSSTVSSNPISSSRNDSSSRDYASNDTQINQNIDTGSNKTKSYSPQKIDNSQAQAAPSIGGTDKISGDSSNRNRYVDQSAVQSQSQPSQSIKTTTTQTDYNIETTQKSTTINISQGGQTQERRLYNSNRGSVVRSTSRANSSKKRQKLAALAAAALLNLATANDALANTQSSGNFLIQDTNVPAKVQSYASDATKESKPQPIAQESGEGIGSYDEDGNFTGGKVATDAQGNPLDSKPKTQGSNSQAPNQGTTSKQQATPPTYPTDGQSAVSSGQGGQYVDGILQQGTTIPEYGVAAQAAASPTRQTPQQQDPYQPSQSGKTNSAANSNAKGKLNNTAQQKKNKPPLASRIGKAVMQTLLTQVSLGAIIVLLLISALVGALSAATYYLLDSTCNNGALVKAAGVAKSLGDVSASTLVGACNTFSAMTGRGCPESKSFAATGKLECIGNEVNSPGETLLMNGPGGSIQVKKATIKEILTAGKEAGVSEFTIKFTIAVHPIESIADGFKALNPYGCLGIAQFCKGGSYETAIRGTGTTSEQDFLNSPVKQMKAIENFLNTKRAEKQNALFCVKLHFSGKSEQYQLFYYWLTADCPGTRDANGFANSDYAGIADKNFAQMACNEFKSKIATNSGTSAPWYGDILSIIGGVQSQALGSNPTPKAVEPDKSDRPINEEEKNKLTELFKSGKLAYELSSLSSYLADLSNPSQPMHVNTGKMLIALAEKFPGITINALGNNTHSNSGGSHNKPMILAIDIGSLSTPYVDIEKQESKEKVQEFINFVDQTKVAAAYGLYPSQIPEISTKTEVFSDDEGHIHISIFSTAGFNGATSNSSSLADCTFNEADLNDRQDGQDISKRLNKKSLTDTQWKELQLIYGRKLIPSKFLELGDEATVSKEVKQMKLFDSQAATDRLYKIALELGYKYRNVVDESELDVINEKGLVKEAKLALKDFIAAANKDGYKGELVSGYRSPLTQKGIFETKLQAECVKAVGDECSAEDIASGKHDAIVRARLAKSSLPYLYKHHTGLAADINQIGVIELENISNTELYKYMLDDNFFNLKRWGFVPSYPDGGKDMGPFPEKWELLYVGKKKLQNQIPASPLITEFTRFSKTLNVLVPNEEKLRSVLFDPIYNGKVQPNTIKVLNQLAVSGQFSKIGVWSLYREEGECSSGNNHKCGLAIDIQWIYRDGRQMTHLQAQSGNDPAATKGFEILADELKKTGLVYQIVSAGDIYNTLRIKEGFNAERGENSQTQTPKRVRMTTTQGADPTARHEDHFHVDILK